MAPSSRASLSLSGVQVDGDDAFRAGDDPAQQRVHADAAQADHRHLPARRHLCGVQHGADAGDHGAAEDRRVLQRHVVRDLDQRILRHHRILREHGQAAVVVDRLAVQRQPACAGDQRAVGARVLELWHRFGPPAVAVAAVTATGDEDADDMVARLQAGDTRSDLLDDAGRLMAGDGRQFARAEVLDGGEVGVAEAGADDLVKHLAGAGRSRDRRSQ